MKYFLYLNYAFYKTVLYTFRYKNLLDRTLTLTIKSVDHPQHLEKDHFVFLTHTVKKRVTSWACFKA